MNQEKLEQLLEFLISNPQETEWIEFKMNRFEEEEFWEIISWLSNTANLFEREFWYLIYWVEDTTHKVKWTTVSCKKKKIWNNPLEHRISQMLNPKIDLRIHEFIYKDKNIVLIEVPRAVDRPVQFKNEAYIRIDSVTRKLKDYPEKERKIWHNAMNINFETEIALSNITDSELLSLLDYPSYFKLTEQALPENRDWIIDKFVQEKFIKKNDFWTYELFYLLIIC